MKICAITTYFNFTKSIRRLENYRMFAKNSGFFLITVELASGDEDFQLSANDADIYIKVSNNEYLWHKESLLNIALNYVPEEFQYVAWIDCDVLFTNRSLKDEICAKMEKYNLVQLFSTMYDMTLHDDHSPKSPEIASGYGVSFLSQKNELFENSLKPRDSMDMRKTLFGLAWASHKSILKKYGFYDYCITGSGDRALYCAAAGQYETTRTNLFMNEQRFNHYMHWANGFNQAIDGKIGYVDGLLLHLYHGEIMDRQYRDRHLEFRKFNFNPHSDIKRLANGTFGWANDTELYNSFFLNYFNNRKEA